ncbi:MAG: SCP2 sterol-binding domain-containing protein [Gammaproteobacteria bacterium]|nr:SCP2 sterol-binding domain-containing protein [Gammaproteobacteria bacterium]
MSITPPTWFAGAVEAACNSALALDPEVRERLGELDGKVIAVELLGVGLQLFFFPHAQGVQVLSHYEGEADTVIRGAPLSLLRLSLSAKPADELFAGGVELRGDTATGQAFQDILRALDLDWEELLSRVAGDDIAHQAGRLLRAAGKQLKHTGHTLEMNVSEYLREEADLLVDHHAVDDFLHAVDDLRSDADRLEARVRRLEATLASKD